METKVRSVLKIWALLAAALITFSNAVDCKYCTGPWTDKCGKYEGLNLRIIMRNHANLVQPFTDIGAIFKNCTGASVSVTEVPMSKWELAVRDDVIDLKLHDGYVMKPIWWQSYADNIETLNDYIRNTQNFDYTDIFPALRNRLSQAGGKTKTLPIDADWSLPFVRRDLIEQHGKNIPETWEEFADLAEYFQGKDLNGDGEPDFGACFDSDSRIDAMLFAVVAPYLQTATQDADQGIVFNANNFDTLFDNPAFRQSIQTFKRIMMASTFAVLGPRDSKAETRVFEAGRCVMYVQRPGVIKSTMMKTITWPMNNSAVTYPTLTMRRIKPPGSTGALNHKTMKYEQCTKELCPWATVGDRNALVNRAPFFWSGGMAFAIRADTDVTSKKALWDLFAYINSPTISTPFVMKKGLYDAFRESHLQDSLLQQYLDNGWKSEEAVRDHLEISGWAMKAESNAVFDLTVPFGQDYLKKIKATTIEYFGYVKADTDNGEKLESFEEPLDPAKTWYAVNLTKGTYLKTKWTYPVTAIWVREGSRRLAHGSRRLAAGMYCGMLTRADGTKTGLLASGAVMAEVQISTPADYHCLKDHVEARGYKKVLPADQLTEDQYIAKLKKGVDEINAQIGTADKAIDGDGGALYGAYQQLKIYRRNINLADLTATDICGTTTNAKYFKAANLETPGYCALKCPAGQYYNSTTIKCMDCSPGFYTPSGSYDQCLNCADGQYSASPKSTACERCGMGKFSFPAGAGKQCNDCAAGSVAPGFAWGSECMDCAPGFFQQTPGSTGCARCPIGQFAQDAGATMCKSCEDILLGGTTSFEGATSHTNCKCDKEWYQGGSANKTCLRCTQGLLCQNPGMTEPKQAMGFYVEPIVGEAEGYSVFRCRDEVSRCPEGKIGKCAAGRKGISCAVCEDSKMPADNGTCDDCTGSDSIPFAAAVAFLLLLMVAMYYVVDTEDRSRQPLTSLLVATVGGMMITSIQQLGVFSTMAVPWVDPIKILLDIMQLINLDIEVIQIGCLMTLSPFALFTCKLGAILFVLACVLVLHFFWVLVRHKMKFWSRMPSLVGIVGIIFMMFQISIVNMAISPLQCLDQPNGMTTVKRYPTIICWEMSEHTSMLYLGLLFLLIPLSFVAGCSFLVYQFPRRMQMLDTQFLHTFAFLFFRFKPEVYWFTIFFILRNLAFALVPILPEPVSQICVMVTIQLVSAGITAMMLPWRTDKANYLDGIVTLGMVNILCLAGFFVPDADAHVVAVLCSILLVFMLTALLAVMGNAFLSRFMQMKAKDFAYFLCHHKGGAGAFARLLKVQLTESLIQSNRTKVLKKGVFLDCDNLIRLDLLFEYVRSLSETVVVILSKEVLLRPWCLGELVTAHLNQPGVKMTPVTTPDYVQPDEAVIGAYASYVDISCLTPFGISIQMIQHMMRWLIQIPAFNMPAELSRDVMEGLCTSIIKAMPPGRQVSGVQFTSTFSGMISSFNQKSETNFEKQTTSRSTSDKSKVPVVALPSSIEALSTAMILCKFVAPYLTEDAQMMPYIMVQTARAQLQPNTATCIFILSQGVFLDGAYLRTMVQAAKIHARWIPVISEDGFRFPSASMLQELEETLLKLIPAESKLVITVIQLIQQIFKEIAIVFSPPDYSATEALLRTQARRIADRLLMKDSRTLQMPNEGVGEQAENLIYRQVSGASSVASAKDQNAVSPNILLL